MMIFDRSPTWALPTRPAAGVKFDKLRILTQNDKSQIACRCRALIAMTSLTESVTLDCRRAAGTRHCMRGRLRRGHAVGRTASDDVASGGAGVVDVRLRCHRDRTARQSHRPPRAYAALQLQQCEVPLRQRAGLPARLPTSIRRQCRELLSNVRSRCRALRGIQLRA